MTTPPIPSSLAAAVEDWLTEHFRCVSCRASHDLLSHLAANHASQLRALVAPVHDIEVLAANVHEQWIEAKKAQGIHTRRSELGEELMVDYALLSEPQKEMDRTLVRTVLKAMGAPPAAQVVQRPGGES